MKISINTLIIGSCVALVVSCLYTAELKFTHSENNYQKYMQDIDVHEYELLKLMDMMLHTEKVSLSENFFKCYKRLNSDEHALALSDLLLLLCELVPYLSNMEKTLLRAPRENALSVTAVNAIVGKDGGCDFTQLIALLNTIKKLINELTQITCDKFMQTWTILDDLDQTICEKFMETWTILDDLDQTVCGKFFETWTILSEIQNNISCPTMPITQEDVTTGGGTLSISEAGNYALAEDITTDFAGGFNTGIIHISASNVSLDLCDRKILGTFEAFTSGILVDPNLNNIRIMNGTIENAGFSGISVRGGTCDIWLENITTSSNIFGIQLNDFGFAEVDLIANVFIDRCQAINCSFVNAKHPTRFVLIPTGGLFMRRCTSVTVRNSNFSENTGINLGIVMSMDTFGTFMNECFNCFFNLCTMNTNWGQQSGSGLSMINSENNTFEGCIFNDNRNTNDAFVVGGGFGVQMSSCFNNNFRNCQASNNFGNLNGVGYRSLTGGNNAFINCVASENNGPGGGFRLTNEIGSSIKECQAFANTATIISGDDCAGFWCETGTNNSIERCQAIGTIADDVAAGYILTGETNSSIINCIGQNSTSLTGTGFGILLDVDLAPAVTCISCYIKNNSIINTTGMEDSIGYRDNGSPNSTSLFTGNFGFNNGTNFSVVYPSGALPTVSGSLSGGLPATGTSGTFDNISINP